MATKLIERELETRVEPAPGAESQYEVVHSKSHSFFEKYERKTDLQHQTHYCPGCGHGVAHKLSHCHVCLLKQRIGSPLVSHPDILIAMNEVSLRKFGGQVAPGGTIFYNRETLPEDLVACRPE